MTPLAADGVLYVTGPNQVFALDALTGERRSGTTRARPARVWSATRDSAPTAESRSCATRSSSSPTTPTCWRSTARTGKLLWEIPMAPACRTSAIHYGGTMAPLIVNDTVIAGVAGADHGIRGFVAAFKPDTGALVWRRWTVPRRGEPGIETWQGKEPITGGGSTWLTGSYDPSIRHALLGHRQSLARRRRPRPSRRQPLHQLRSRARSARPASSSGTISSRRTT